MKQTQPWPIEEFTEECVLFRHCHYLKRERVSKKERRHPNESSFIMRPGEDSLSFNWSKFAGPEKSLIIIGLSFGSNGNYIQYKDYTIFGFSYSSLKTIEGIDKITHSPEFYGNPSDVGSPNNKAHSLVYFDNDDLRVRVNLSEYCKSNYDQSKRSVNFSSLEPELEELRKRLNDTEYHRLWEFESN